MPDLKLSGLITSLFVFMQATSAIAEQLEPGLQKDRDQFNKLSDQACAGDLAAYNELFDHAANRRNAIAMNALGWLTENQHCKFSRADEFSAALKFQISAEAGYPIGQNNYARYLMEGKGIRRDPKLAKEYFNRAMDAGYGEAAVTLGLYYLSAEFLPIDDIKARALYDRAVKEGADPERLAKLAAELEKNEAMSNPQMTEIDQPQRLFTGAWGVGYGEARWDYAPDGKFKSRVAVGVYDDSKRYYLQMMLDTYNPIVGLLGIHVRHADGTVFRFDLSFCQVDTCDILQYGDNFGYPGSVISIELPPSKQGEMLEALKSGSTVVFDYKTKTGPAHNRLSLKGSRKAIERLARANGLPSAAATGAALAMTPKAQTAIVPIMLLPDTDHGTCSIGLRVNAGGAELRSGPGPEFPVVATYKAGHVVAGCAEKNGWSGIIDGQDETCSVGISVATKQPYVGTCKSGWIDQNSLTSIYG